MKSAGSAPFTSNSLSTSLRAASEADAAQLLNWVDSQAFMTQWAGPDIQFPITPALLSQQIRISQLSSFTLLGGADAEAQLMVGFGQVYERLGANHLCRLIVAPDKRGQGLGECLLRHLLTLKKRPVDKPVYSLFVMKNNQSALRLYQKLGFEITAYPGGLTGDLSLCHYMKKGDK